MAIRIEQDTLGPVELPADALYGAQTARAVANFPISGLKPFPAFVRATLLIKKCAALANMATGRLAPEIGNAIVVAANEALLGLHSSQFVVDPFQAGAGTSHNMNVNEVLANRAGEILGAERGIGRVNANDHVNMAQSTNDVIPTAIRLASLKMLSHLVPELERLHDALARKGKEFDGILKSGRTHLQDAVPIRLGQEFAAHAVAVGRALRGLVACRADLCELGLGGTAVGTGLNAEERYIDLVVAELARETGLPLFRAGDLVETTFNMDPFVALSGALRRVAVVLVKLSGDLRLLASGPRTGFDEITLPAVQPGSSIMPGKVNPVMAEMISMVSFQVMGCDATVALAAQAGQLELNVMMPVIAFNLVFAMEILTNGVERLTTLSIDGITANEARCRRYLDDSLGLVTIFAPYIGYAAAAEVAKESAKTGRSIREIVLERGHLSAEEIEAILDPYPLTSPGVPGSGQVHLK
jgi:aspartate ammonia-lyase